MLIIPYKENPLWATQAHVCAALGMWAVSVSPQSAMELDSRPSPVALDLNLKGTFDRAGRRTWCQPGAPVAPGHSWALGVLS